VGSVRDELVDLHLGLGGQPIPDLRGRELQRQIHGQRVNDEIPDACLALQHEPVLTAGKRTSPLDRRLGDAGTPVVEVDRGGKITWHGPGQLVGYPVIRVGEPVDVIAYVRAIEEALMRACADAGAQHHPGRGTQRSVGARPAGAQDRRDRDPGVAA
jgi:lipoyl(octanoyl) transferase